MSATEPPPDNQRREVRSVVTAYTALIAEAQQLILTCEQGIAMDEHAIAQYHEMIARLQRLVETCRHDLTDLLHDDGHDRDDRDPR